uniref:Uncharacterized protein n=1 Tax=Glossina morsitans morsitans TaxID=37546 RepID=A0A1B0GAJ9_GLOMM
MQVLEAIINVDNIGKWKLLLVSLMSLEVESISELTTVFLQNELHPKKIPYRPAFAKLKDYRGAKHITK